MLAGSENALESICDGFYRVGKLIDLVDRKRLYKGSIKMFSRRTTFGEPEV
jgi:hypothetical protein